jgi:hypothetical protein
MKKNATDLVFPYIPNASQHDSFSPYNHAKHGHPMAIPYLGA